MQKRSRAVAAVLLATALVIGIPFSPTIAADWDWLEEQKKKFLDDVYEGTKKVIVDEAPQPAVEAPPAAEVEAQPPAANPPKIEQQPAQVQATLQSQPADTPRFDKPWVTEIQTHLTSLGYKPGAIDGAFGNKSQKAISAFQQKRGDAVTGLPTPTVMQALRSEADAASEVTAQTKLQTTPPVVEQAPPQVATKISTAAPSSATPIYEADDLRPLATSASKYAAWADVCSDPAGVAVRNDFLARADLLAPEEQAGIIQQFEKQYSKKKKNAEPLLEKCILQGKTDCCTVGEEVARPFDFVRNLYQTHIAKLDAAPAPIESPDATVESAATAPPVASPPPSAAAAPPTESSESNSESVAAAPAPANADSTQITATAEYQTPRIRKLKVEDFAGMQWDRRKVWLLVLVDIDVHIAHCLGFREPISDNIGTYAQATSPEVRESMIGAYENRYDKFIRVGIESKYTQLGGSWHYRTDDCAVEVIEDLYFAYEKWEQNLLGIVTPVAAGYQIARISKLTVEDFKEIVLKPETYNPVTLEYIVRIDLHIQYCLKFREPIKENYDAYLLAAKVENFENRSFQYENKHLNYGDSDAHSELTIIYPETYKRSDCRTKVIAKLYSEYDKWEKGLFDGTRSW
jgi:peptidoglycan hydrolase-like protein with peptidoglycan-binding domain